MASAIHSNKCWRFWILAPLVSSCWIFLFTRERERWRQLSSPAEFTSRALWPAVIGVTDTHLLPLLLLSSSIFFYLLGYFEKKPKNVQVSVYLVQELGCLVYLVAVHTNKKKKKNGRHSIGPRKWIGKYVVLHI